MHMEKTICMENPEFNRRKRMIWRNIESSEHKCRLYNCDTNKKYVYKVSLELFCIKFQAAIVPLEPNTNVLHVGMCVWTISSLPAGFTL